jgi:hypothetical protein
LDKGRSQFYSFKTHILIGEIDYAVESYKEDYKNTPSRDRLDGSSVFREKEASLLLSQRERIRQPFLPARKRQRKKDGGNSGDKTKFPNQGNDQIVLQIHIKEEHETKNQDYRS